MTTKTDNSNITNNIPSEELLESLKEIEDYKKWGYRIRYL